MAKDKPALYTFQRSFLKVFSIPQAALHWQGESLFGNRIPNLMYVVLIKTRDLQGDNNGNPYTFFITIFPILHFMVIIEPYGGKSWKCWISQGMIPPSWMLIADLFCDEGHEPDIDREDFRLGYIIFVYKSATNSPNTLSLEGRGHTRLENTTQGLLTLCDMDSETITEILLNDKVTNRYYGGVMSCDSLPQKAVSGNKYYIINTETKDSGLVEHWIVLYFNINECDFFDPLSRTIKQYNQFIFEFMYNNFLQKLSYSTKKIQAPESDK